MFFSARRIWNSEVDADLGQAGAAEVLARAHDLFITRPGRRKFREILIGILVVLAIAAVAMVFFRLTVSLPRPWRFVGLVPPFLLPGLLIPSWLNWRAKPFVHQALREAFKYPSLQLLMAGYFVCGFQVVFIGVHMPSYLKDKGLSPQVASYALAVIGLFNVFGTYIAGSLGQKMAKRKILATIYFSRAIVIAVFLAAPLSPLSVYIFASLMGLLWLSTVPPTNAVVAQIFGIQHLSMLGGFVFFSHQIGSFLGVWLGGYLYDRTGSYDVVWMITIALGVFAGLVNLPVKEAAIRRGTALKAT